MAPAELDLTDERAIMQGDSYELTVTVSGSLYATTDFSATGWAFAASLRPGLPGNTATPVTGEVEFGVDVDDDTVGTAVVTLSLTPAQTASLAWRSKWVWDFQVTNPTGGVLTLIRGTSVTVLPQVTA
jgi:hypothetical protein